MVSTAGKAGINGAAALAIGGGLVLAISSVKNSTVPDVLREIVGGRPITGQSAGSVAEAMANVTRQISEAASSAVTSQEASTSLTNAAQSIAGGARGAVIVSDVRKYLGIPYKFGGATPSKGFDCSGLVTYVLHHDLGVDLPSNSHTTAIQFYMWSGLQTVPWDQQQPGDLVCWTGHIGIAIGNRQMINAPHTGSVVKVSNIWTTPKPLIRRLK